MKDKIFKEVDNFFDWMFQVLSKFDAALEIMGNILLITILAPIVAIISVPFLPFYLIFRLHRKFKRETVRSTNSTFSEQD